MNIQKKSTDSTWRLLDKSKLTYFNVTTAKKKSYSKNKIDRKKKNFFLNFFLNVNVLVLYNRR